jgi:hypothetical protein
MLADAPHFYQSIPGIRLPPRRMSGPAVGDWQAWRDRHTAFRLQVHGQVSSNPFRRLTGLYRHGPRGGIFDFRQQSVETTFGRSYRG